VGWVVVLREKFGRAQVLQRMLRRSRAKLEHDTERLKLQAGVAHLRETALLRLLKREKTTLHSKQQWRMDESDRRRERQIF
jgi:hypothetical protein